MSIEAKNLTKIFGNQKAVDDVSFSISKGEIVGFLGPNGAGKTTTMRIISCFIPQTSGVVNVCNYDVVDDSMEVRKKIGYLPENNPLYLDMYVKEYLSFIGRFYKLNGSINSKVSEMINLVGLEKEQKKKIGALSKGYRQRVGLAQTLIHNPEVLILDEPTSGLDPNQIVEIRNLIKKIGKEKTVLFSTHIMQEVEAICNRIIIIDKGKIVKDENTQNLYKSNQKEGYIIAEFKEFVESKMLLDLPKVKNVKSIGENKWLIGTENDIETRAALFEFAKKNNFTLISLQKQEEDLQSIFQKLTQK